MCRYLYYILNKSCDWRPSVASLSMSKFYVVVLKDSMYLGSKETEIIGDLDMFD
jgi:hypothetical protein